EAGDDYEDDPPRRRRRSRSSRGAPHRGTLIMILGLISDVCVLGSLLGFCCGPLALLGAISLGLGIPAWVRGSRALARVMGGEMDDRGRGMTMTGFICGIVGTILSILILIGAVILIIFWGAMMAGGGFAPAGGGGGGFKPGGGG